MKLKKFEKVVKYYILKHQKSILSDAMEKGVEYCKKNIGTPSQKYLLESEHFKLHKDKLREIMQKHMLIVTENNVKSMHRMVSDSYIKDEDMYNYAEAIMAFVENPTIDKISTLDPMLYSFNEKLLYVYRKGYADNADYLIDFSVMNLTKLMKAYSLSKMIESDFGAAGGVEMMKTILSDNKYTEIVKIIDKYIPKDSIDVKDFLDAIQLFKFKSIYPSIVVNIRDIDNTPALEAIIDKIAGVKNSSTNIETDMIKSLVIFTLNEASNKIAYLLDGTSSKLDDVVIEGLSNMRELIETSNIRKREIVKMNEFIRSYIGSEMTQFIGYDPAEED
nr:MAG TPA: hypothetical protein [Caudoviricetes sp.]